MFIPEKFKGGRALVIGAGKSGIACANLLAARGFAEGLGQLEPARQLLGFIRQRYPASPLLGEVASLEAIITKLAAVPS